MPYNKIADIRDELDAARFDAHLLREEKERQRQTLEGVVRTLAAVSNGWPYEHEPALDVSQALKLACDTIDDLRAENERLRVKLEKAQWSVEP